MYNLLYITKQRKVHDSLLFFLQNLNAMAILLPLKSQFTSLIITVISAVCEFALLYAITILNGLYECKKLKRGKVVSLRRHILRSSVITFVSLALFFFLEIITSFLSDPADIFTTENHSCVSVGNLLKRKNDSLDFPIANDIFAKCLRRDFFIIQSAGNYSKENRLIQCAEQPIYSFRDSELTNMSVSGATPGCMESDQGTACVFAAQRGNITFISDIFLKAEMPLIQELPSFQTMLHFEAKGMLRLWAERTVRSRVDGFSSPAQLRRLVFTGAENTNCDFNIFVGDGTSIQEALLVLLVVMWGLSLILFSLSILLKKNVFYDIGKPLHWATKTFRVTDDDVGDNPRVCSQIEKDDPGVFLSGVE